MAATSKHFIIGGAQRCATSYLARLLGAHPQIAMAEPARPEPKYFLSENLTKNAVSFYHDKHFSHVAAQDSFILGEKSTSYIESIFAAEQIIRYLPGAKIIFLLRNPIDRAVSNYLFSRMNGFESAPINDAIVRELDDPTHLVDANKAGISVSPHSYLERGHYAKFLMRYLQIFETKNVKIVLTENLLRSKNTLEDIYRFLDVDPSFSPKIIGETINASHRTETDQLSATVRARLTAYYEPKNKELERLTGLDLSPWN